MATDINAAHFTPKGVYTRDQIEGLNSWKLTDTKGVDAKGRKYEVYTRKIHHDKFSWKFLKGLAAFAATFFSLGLALFAKDVRALWLQAIRGDEERRIKVLTTLPPSENKTNSVKSEALPSTKPEEAEANIKALILALSKLDSDNYKKTKQFLVDSPDEIVCAAIRRSIENKEYATFLATMGDVKFESVFRTAAEEAHKSNDYQLFALLVSQSSISCRKQIIIDIVKEATNGNKAKIEILRSEVNKHLKHLDNPTLINIYGSILDAAIIE